MRDYMSIGPVPCDEKCAQVGDEGYYERAREECARFIEVIRTKLGCEPPGARLAVKSCPHDFGSYLDVVCHFEDSDETATEYAFLCEAEAPRTWEDTTPLAKKSYRLIGYLDISMTVEAFNSHIAEVHGKRLLREKATDAGLSVVEVDAVARPA